MIQRILLPILLSVVLCLLLGGRAAAQDSVAVQLNQAHSGALVSGSMAPALTPAWSVNFGANVSYPIIAAGKVCVVVSSSGGQIYALNASTGAVAWGPVGVGGQYYTWNAEAYDAGRLFVVNESGLEAAFDINSGVELWSRQLPGQYAFSSAPCAMNGIVYTGGAGEGGTLYAVDEVTGALLWTQSVANGDDSSPAVTGSGVYVTYPAGQDYDFDPVTGNLIWHYPADGDGGGGATPVYYNNRLYTEDWAGTNLILNATTGAYIGVNPSGTDSTPAFYGQQGFYLSGGTLEAAGLSGTGVQWSFAGDGTLATSPIYLNGYVYIGSGNGNFYALSHATGQVQWTGTLGSGASSGDGNDIAAGDGFVVVPAGTQLVAYNYSVTTVPIVIFDQPQNASGTAITLDGTVNPNGLATTAYFEYGLDTTYGTQSQSSALGSGSAALPVTEQISGLAPNTTYHVRLTATNASGITHSEDETFTTADEGVPTVVTGVPSSATQETAVLTGTVNPNGLDTTAWFQYGLSASYTGTTAAQDAGSGDLAVSTSGSLSGLSGNTTYHYRIVAVNSSGTSIGNDATFLTPPNELPTVVTGTAIILSHTSVELVGDINPNGFVSSAYFEYGLNATYGVTTAPAVTGTQTNLLGESEIVVGLQPGVTYHFRIDGEDANGTVYGADQAFTMPPQLPPAAVTGSASNITGTSATVTGSANDEGLFTTAFFEYGTDTNYGSDSSMFGIQAGTGNVVESATLTGLSTGLTYHYRLVASSAAGTGTGSDMTFTTASTAPSAETGGASNITPTTAIVTGTASDNGLATGVYFEYGTDTSYGETSGTFNIAAGTGSVAESGTLSGLIPGLTYHYRIAATNSLGTVTGSDASFTTPPAVTTASDVTVYIAGGVPVDIDVLADVAGGNVAGYRVVSVTQGSGGADFIGANNTIVYIPGSNFHNLDIFSYTVTDGVTTATANVIVRSLFASQAGTYNTIIGSGGSLQQDWGSISVTASPSGALTGVVDLAGRVFRFQGQLRASGTYTATFGPPGGATATLSLKADPADGVFNGSIAGEESSVFTIPKVPFSATNPAPETGSYTVLLSATESGAQGTPQVLPAGMGAAAMNVADSGAATITGWLGDGVPFAAGGYVRADGSLPLYGTTGSAGHLESICGTVQFRSIAGTSDFDGLLGWDSAPAKGNGAYSNGFAAGASVIGSRYTAPAHGIRVLQFANTTANGILDFGQAGTAASPSPLLVTLSANNTIGGGRGKLSMAIGLGNGLFLGAIAGPSTQLPFRGAIFQRQNIGSGWFVERSFTGPVTLEAVP